MPRSDEHATGVSILILANGDWTDEARLRSASERSAHTIAADGAWAKAQCLGLHVDTVIGDLDSLTLDEAAHAEAATEVLSYPMDKDWTDLELALDLALTMSPERIVVFGALGDRLDHSLAAVFLLEKAATHDVPIELIGNQETAWPVLDEIVLHEARAGDRVSLLPISDEVVVSTAGLRYGLSNETLVRAASRGVSNVVAGAPVRIVVQSGRLLVIHAPNHGEES